MDDNTCEDWQNACRVSAEVNSGIAKKQLFWQTIYVYFQFLAQCAMKEKSSQEENVNPKHTKSAYLVLTFSLLQDCPIS